MNHICVLVSNDLVHDQRVRKVCETLSQEGFDITLIGRKLGNSEGISRPYETKRFRLLFNKGALFYASLNIRLFFYLLFKKTDIILANDLDTLWPASIVARLRGKKLVYDSHEYFTEAAGLTGRSFQKNVWLWIEKRTFSKPQHVYTVNSSIAQIYKDKYKVPVGVVRNIPEVGQPFDLKPKAELGISSDKKMILLQGAFIDIDRGCKEAVEAMQYLDDAVLFVIGAGEEKDLSEQLAKKLELGGKVIFLDKMPKDLLRHYTAHADLGLSLDKPIHLNYKYSLPNKLFDYIREQTPILTSDLPELRKIQEQYNIGMMVSSHDPKHIAQQIKEALISKERDQWAENLKRASDELTWENESKVIRAIFREFLS